MFVHEDIVPDRAPASTSVSTPGAVGLGRSTARYPVPAVPANSQPSNAGDAARTRWFAPTSLQFSRTPGGLSDTGWEPRAVYRHLTRLTRIAADASIPIVQVSNGDIRADAIDPAHRFASMPL
jgi:hypothetical protein